MTNKSEPEVRFSMDLAGFNALLDGLLRDYEELHYQLCISDDEIHTRGDKPPFSKEWKDKRETLYQAHLRAQELLRFFKVDEQRIKDAEARATEAAL